MASICAYKLVIHEDVFFNAKEVIREDDFLDGKEVIREDVFFDGKEVIREDVFFDANEQFSNVENCRDILDTHNNVNDPTDKQAPSTNEKRLSSKRSLDNTGEPLPSDQPQPAAKKTKVSAPKKEANDENSKPAPSTTTTERGQAVTKRKLNNTKSDDENTSKTTPPAASKKEVNDENSKPAPSTTTTERGQTAAKRKFNNVTTDDENTPKTTPPAAPKSKPSSKKIKVLNSKQTLGDISNKSLPSASVKPKKTIKDKQQPQTAVDKPAAIDSKIVIKSNTPPVPPSATHANNNKIQKLPRILRHIARFRARMRLKLPRISEVKAFCGFENENTVCHAEGQLYTLYKGLRWKKRGAGAFLLDKDENESRLVLLNETDFRLILNLKLFFGMKALVMDEQYVRFDAFDTVQDIYGRPEVKLVNYALKVDDADTAQEICKQINACIPSTPSPVPKETTADAINKDVAAIIAQLMPKKQWALQ